MMDGIKALSVVHNKRIMSIRNVFIFKGEKLNFPPDLTLKLIIYSSAREASSMKFIRWVAEHLTSNKSDFIDFVCIDTFLSNSRRVRLINCHSVTRYLAICYAHVAGLSNHLSSQIKIVRAGIKSEIPCALNLNLRRFPREKWPFIAYRSLPRHYPLINLWKILDFRSTTKKHEVTWGLLWTHEVAVDERQ